MAEHTDDDGDGFALVFIPDFEVILWGWSTERRSAQYEEKR